MWFIYGLVLNRIVWRFVKICELMLDISSTLLLSTSLHLSKYWRMAKAKVSSVDLTHPGLEKNGNPLHFEFRVEFLPVWPTVDR